MSARTLKFARVQWSLPKKNIWYKKSSIFRGKQLMKTSHTWVDTPTFVACSSCSIWTSYNKGRLLPRLKEAQPLGGVWSLLPMAMGDWYHLWSSTHSWWTNAAQIASSWYYTVHANIQTYVRYVLTIPAGYCSLVFIPTECRNTRNTSKGWHLKGTSPFLSSPLVPSWRVWKAHPFVQTNYMSFQRLQHSKRQGCSSSDPNKSAKIDIRI